jgi:hypothetical protein
MSHIATDNPLTPDERQTLTTLAGMIIPASIKYDAPGADDETILADILLTACQHAELLKEGLTSIDAHAREQHRVAFSSLAEDQRTLVAEHFRQASPRFMRSLVSITVQCYYRDPRVMASLGMAPRPPFPKGFDLDPGDWSMLDPVRDRGRIWRDAT